MRLCFWKTATEVDSYRRPLRCRISIDNLFSWNLTALNIRDRIIVMPACSNDTLIILMSNLDTLPQTRYATSPQYVHTVQAIVILFIDVERRTET